MRMGGWLCSVLMLGWVGACDSGTPPDPAVDAPPAAPTPGSDAESPGASGTPTSPTPERVATKPRTARPGGLAEQALGKAPKPTPEVPGAVPVPSLEPPIPEPGAVPGASGTVVARVGTVEITTAEFQALYDLKEKKYVDRGREIPQTAARRYRNSLLERLSYHEVLRQEALRAGVDYDNKELAKRSVQQKRGIRDWAKHLERRGESEASLTALVVAELREYALLDARGELDVSQAELEADYAAVKSSTDSPHERIRASHILVKVEGGVNEADAEAKADLLYAEAVAPGADFADLARTHSSGPSASKGGELGVFTADRMVEEFSDVAFAMSVGEISRPVKTKFGYHVIKVVGRWPKGVLPMEALEDQARARLQARKLHTGRRALKEELNTKTKVLWFLDPNTGAMLATGQAPTEYKRESKTRRPRGERPTKEDRDAP